MSTPPGIKEAIKFEEYKEYEVDNEFKLKISYNKELMLIEIEEKILFPKKERNMYINLAQLQKIDNYFCQFESLPEVCDSFEELVKMKNLYIIKDEENTKIKIINPLLKKKEIYINIKSKEREINKEIDSIISYISVLNDNMNNMKNEYDNKIKKLEEKIAEQENTIKSIQDKLNIKESSNQKLKSTPKKALITPKNEIDSKIIKNIEEFYFVNERLENNFNGNIKYNLIYRATRDGSKTEDFNKNCNGKNNQLIILKTTKGIIFGGYTERGFQNSKEGKIKDDSVFLFSLYNKKIYNIKKGSYAIYEYTEGKYGIFFGKCDGNNPIFLGGSNCDMLLYKCYTCPKSNEEYDFMYDYELSGGEKKFNLEEIEVFQIEKN
jgi:hypothetical protein